MISDQRLRIKVTEELCQGCLSCMTICSLVKESYASLSSGRVQVRLSPFDGKHRIIICRHCPKAACVEACPEEAMIRDSEGLVVIDQQRCTACGACADACPFEAVFLDPITERMVKCDLCGRAPQCVDACPTGALVVRLLSDRGS